MVLKNTETYLTEKAIYECGSTVNVKDVRGGGPGHDRQIRRHASQSCDRLPVRM